MLTFILTSSIFNACSAAGNAAEPCAVKSTCVGTLKLGSNKLAVSGENIYYTFESENDGVYSLSAALVSAYKNTGDITSGEPLSPLFAVPAGDETAEFKHLYYFKGGETVFIIRNNPGGNSTLVIEYLGKIEDIKHNSNSLKIMGSDVCYDEKTGRYLIVGAFEMSFSGTAEKYESGEVYTDKEITRGENSLTVYLLGKIFAFI